MSAKHAVVSIGTNSTRLLIVEESDGRLEPMLQRSIGTRLGANLAARGKLDPAGVERTLAAIDEYVLLVQKEKADPNAISTSAMRRADDAAAFAAEVERRVGAPLEIISGKREAELSFRGATHAQTGHKQRLGVLDVGGGSAEYACGHARIEAHASCEIGAVRLSEAIPALLGAQLHPNPQALEREARAYAAGCLEPLRGMPRPSKVFAVGGTAFNAALLLDDLGREDLDGTLLPRAALQDLARRFLCITVEERRAQPRISAQRADIFPAGLLIVDEALGLLGVSECTLSRADLLFGYLVDRYGKGGSV